MCSAVMTATYHHEEVRVNEAWENVVGDRGKRMYIYNCKIHLTCWKFSASTNDNSECS